MTDSVLVSRPVASKTRSKVMPGTETCSNTSLVCFHGKDIEGYVRFEVFTAMAMKNAVFWDVGPCTYFANRRFGGTYCLHLQGIVDFLYPEDGVDTFLRNVG
jgi:hypothetical protein